MLFYFLETLLSGASPHSVSHFLSSLVWKGHITVLIVQLATWPHLDARKAGNHSDFSGWDTTFWRLFYTVKGKCLFLLHPTFQKTTLSVPAGDTIEDLCTCLSVWCGCGADVHASCFLLPLVRYRLFSDPIENIISHPWCFLSPFLIFFPLSHLSQLGLLCIFLIYRYYFLNPSMRTGAISVLFLAVFLVLDT